MAKFKLKAKTKNILLIILGCVLLFGAIFGIIALFNQDEKTTKTISPSYAVGGLNNVGAYSSTKESIYTKDAFDCYGLKVTPDFTSTVKYQIFFYDKDNAFLQSSSMTNNKFDSKDTAMPQYTKYARIVITPNDDTNIKWYEVNKYAKQIKIEVNKDQSKESGVFVPQNLFEIDANHIGSFVGADGSNNIAYADNSSFGATKPIDVSNISKLKFVYSEDALSHDLTYWFFNDSDISVSSGTTQSGQKEIVVSVPTGATKLIVNYQLGEEFFIFSI